MIFTYNNPPKTNKEGFTNLLKMAANAITDGTPKDAWYLLSDMIDTMASDRTEFSYGPVEPIGSPRGDMSDAEWSRIVD